MRLVDADKLPITPVTTRAGVKRPFVLLSDIMNAPTVDAEPVRHGHWVENNGRYGWYCSQCKKENNYAYCYNESNAIELQDHYCPNCGAKMDEVEDGKTV